MPSTFTRETTNNRTVLEALTQVTIGTPIAILFREEGKERELFQYFGTLDEPYKLGDKQVTLANGRNLLGYFRQTSDKFHKCAIRAEDIHLYVTLTERKEL